MKPKKGISDYFTSIPSNSNKRVRIDETQIQPKEKTKNLTQSLILTSKRTFNGNFKYSIDHNSDIDVQELNSLSFEALKHGKKVVIENNVDRLYPIFRGYKQLLD